jgi:hypothetical protein
VLDKWSAARAAGSTAIQKGPALDFFASTFYGFFFGFALGVGCSLVVLYAIYSGGYRKALEDSLRSPPSDRYLRSLAKAKAKTVIEASQQDDEDHP